MIAMWLASEWIVIPGLLFFALLAFAGAVWWSPVACEWVSEITWARACALSASRAAYRDTWDRERVGEPTPTKFPDHGPRCLVHVDRDCTCVEVG